MMIIAPNIQVFMVPDFGIFPSLCLVCAQSPFVQISPDIICCRMPAYDANQWYALFFVVFLIINLYIFMNVLLAVIFNSYKNNLKVSAATHGQKLVMQSGILKTLPQCKFSLEFPDTLMQNLICYQCAWEFQNNALWDMVHISMP